MNRALTYLNLCGVLALVLLCLFQWQTNDELTRETDRQKTQIAEQEKMLAGNRGELDDLRGQLSAAQAALKTSDENLHADAKQIEQLSAQRDRLKASLDQWVNAVASRDSAIRQANEEIQKISAARTDAQQRLNALTVKYNEDVK